MIRVAAFGDSLTDPNTYVDLPDRTWLQQMESSLFPVEVAANKASGGAVSGKAGDWVYSMDGAVLETPGMLGQVDEFIAEDIEADVHVIWVGTNDLVIASQLDPFTTVGGMRVEASQRVQDDRAALRLGKRAYADFIVDNYTVPNIREAVAKLSPRGEVVVIGPFCMEKTIVANQSSRTRSICLYARRRLNNVLKNSPLPYYVDLSNIDVAAVDEVHLGQESQRQVMQKVYSAV